MSLNPIKKAVIPAAGYGTRFLPITKVVPKELLPIGNKPAIHYIVEEAVASGVEEVILVCHPAKTEIVDYFRPNAELRKFLEGKGKKEDLLALEEIESMARFQVVYQSEPLGLGHAVHCAREAVASEPFLVLLPDVLVVAEKPASRQLCESLPKDSDWGLLVKRVEPEEIPFHGIVRGDQVRDRVYGIAGAVEKPKLQDAPSNLAILGRYILPPEIFDVLRSMDMGSSGEIQLTDAIDLLTKDSPGYAVIVEGDALDTGTPEGWANACRTLAR